MPGVSLSEEKRTDARGAVWHPDVLAALIASNKAPA